MRTLRKQLKLIVLAGIGIIAVVAVATLFVLPRFLPGAVNIQFGGGEPAAAATAPPEHGVVPITLGERVVNLADPGGFRYLKTEIVLGLSADEMPDLGLDPERLEEDQAVLNREVELIRPEAQDIVTTVLTAKTVAQASTPEGKEAIKQELIARLDPLFSKRHLRIEGIYFAQFIIQ